MAAKVGAPDATGVDDRAQVDQGNGHGDDAAPNGALHAAQRIAAARGWALMADRDDFALYGPRGRVVRRQSLEAAVLFVECAP